ncbi:uncharacterized protein [Watersipora subatra]|uniref:uncharacterized protein n=1 Tax=Watersipora subatra TaxID=2589382 RepID=UPI00355BD29C
MANRRNPFRAILWSSWFTIIFGFISLSVGIIYTCSWLAAVGVFGNVSKDKRLWIGYSHGGASGAAVAIMAACGLWCGIWVLLTGVCGATISLRKSSGKNNRTRIVVGMASAFNALIFCPIQIGLYSYLFVPLDIWFDELFIEKPVWWAVALQAVGITSGVVSFILCIISIVVAIRIKPYAGSETRTWEDIHLDGQAVSI